MKKIDKTDTLMDAGYSEVLKSAGWSQREWRQALENHPRLADHFHLRACYKKTTIVSTHPVKPMAGCKVSGKSLPRELEALGEAVDAGRIADHLLADGRFKPRKKGQEEARFQARLITDINTSAAGALKEALGVKELRFLSSEMVLHHVGGNSKKMVMDVIALVDGKICIIEMKEPVNPEDAARQAWEYMEHYRNVEDFYELINRYLGQDLVEMGRTELVGLGMYGYGTDAIPLEKPVLFDGVRSLRYSAD